MPRGNHEIVMILEDERNGERAFKLAQCVLNRDCGIMARIHLARHQMGDQFRIGIGDKFGACRFEVDAKLFEILNNAVVDHRHPLRHMRVGVRFRRRAMGRPARMTYAQPA